MFYVYSIFAYLLISVFKTVVKILKTKKIFVSCTLSVSCAFLFAVVSFGFFLSCWRPLFQCLVLLGCLFILMNKILKMENWVYWGACFLVAFTEGWWLMFFVGSSPNVTVLWFSFLREGAWLDGCWSQIKGQGGREGLPFAESPCFPWGVHCCLSLCHSPQVWYLLVSVAVQKCLSWVCGGAGGLPWSFAPHPFSDPFHCPASQPASQQWPPYSVSPSSALWSDSCSFRLSLPIHVLCSSSKCFLGGVHLSLSCSCLWLNFDKRRSAESVLHPAIRNIYSKSWEVSPVLTAQLSCGKGCPSQIFLCRLWFWIITEVGKGSTRTPALRPRRTSVGSLAVGDPTRGQCCIRARAPLPAFASCCITKPVCIFDHIVIEFVF